MEDDKVNDGVDDDDDDDDDDKDSDNSNDDGDNYDDDYDKDEQNQTCALSHLHNHELVNTILTDRDRSRIIGVNKLR